MKFYKHSFISRRNFKTISEDRTIKSGSLGLTDHLRKCQGNLRKAGAENHLFYLVIKISCRRYTKARGPGLLSSRISLVLALSCKGWITVWGRPRLFAQYRA